MIEEPDGAAGFDAADGDLGRAVAELRRMPADRPERGPLAVELIRFILRDPIGATARLQHFDALLEIADGRVPETPEWQRVRACARALALTFAVAERRITDLPAVLTALDELEQQAAGAAGARQLFDLVRAGVGVQQAMVDGDLAAVRDLPARIGTMREEAGAHPAVEPVAEVLAKAADLAAGQQRGDDPFGLMAELRAAAEALPPGHHLRNLARQMSDMLAPFEGIMRGGTPTMASDEQITALGALAEQGAFDQAMAHAAAGAAALGAGKETDLDRVDLGIEHFRSALALAGPDHPERAFFLFSVALGLMRRSELTNSLADLREVEQFALHALAAAGGPRHQLWPEINEMLAHTRRRLSADSQRKQALEGLRAHTWRVLVQPDLSARNRAARDAAGNVIDVARLCLAEGDPDDAIHALDAGRGLALYAAIATRNVADQLLAAGLTELAERWQAARRQGPDRLPTGLRHEVLTALSEHDTIAGLLDPPKPAEIHDALRALDLDALVYLMPGDTPHPGHAIITTADGRSSFMPLPNLVLGAGLDIERDLAALSVRDVPASPEPTRDLSVQETEDLVAGVNRLCDWAWRAAIGPLLERGLAGLPTGPDALPRVVLVPVGELARIPWPAARRGDGTHAVKLASFSQAASARMLCHCAKLAPVAPSSLGLVVGDPDTKGQASDLRAARLEAYAVQQTFYRAGRYLGRWPNGRPNPAGGGTAEQLRAWLGDTGPAAGTTLHLACHGVVRADPGAATSYLLLAGGESDGERLAAEEIAELMGRSPGRAVGLVVLAACRTGQSINGYDEAYSLGTAFLAGGARSVLSTRWAIPDVATSALMFMFHHYVMTEGRPAREALRRAQLWMLDPERRWPAEMPARLRAVLDPDELPSVAAWAGFVHWGQ